MNAYALQVEPARLADRDRVILGYREALRIEEVRDAVFIALARILDTNRKRDL
ncbi:hypothetical protein H8E07_11560 [bacterium]|nr:hypothetical protein [bacterium]